MSRVYTTRTYRICQITNAACGDCIALAEEAHELHKDCKMCGTYKEWILRGKPSI